MHFILKRKKTLNSVKVIRSMFLPEARQWRGFDEQILETKVFKTRQVARLFKFFVRRLNKDAGANISFHPPVL